MKILVINGECIQTNTSANLCHLAYIRGLVDSGHEVTVISADGRDYKLDESMKIPSGVKSYTYYSVSLYEKLSLKKSSQTDVKATGVSTVAKKRAGVTDWLREIVKSAKRLALAMYGVHGIYGKFVKKAKRFRTEEVFDYILSLSTPPSSHLLAYKLIKMGRVQGKHWIQIWEDPWYSDVYGFNSKKKIYREEKRLLSFAEKICYVSPLTLRNQQRLFPEMAEKMYWQPLPYYYQNQDSVERRFEENRYGYFGDYTPAARNLEPFYDAAVQEGIEVNICGNPSDLFVPTEKIHIHSRLPLEQLKPIEDNTNVLIFLCNRQGGQIPGKIYQYSATNKVILFILDGTQEEKEVLKSYFAPFKRYVFCENTKEDIARALKQIEKGEFGSVINEPIEAFAPQKTIKKILEG